MKKFKGHCKMEPGDFLVLNQKDGRELHVHVTENGVMVKAPNLGTTLSVEKITSYTRYTRFVKVIGS